MAVSREQIIAFRLASQHLAERTDGLLDVARMGVQDSPPGSALIALNARVQNLSPDSLDGLFRTWSLRGAPFCFPPEDAPVFTTGVLPPDEQGLRHFLPGLVPAVEALGLTVTEAVELTGAEVRKVLTGRRLAIGELGSEVAQRMSVAQRAAWEAPGPYAPGQPLSEAVVHFCLRVLTLQGVVCFATRVGNKAPFVLVEEWLGHPIAQIDPLQARAELLRRYLHVYGPSTPVDFAAWLGVQVGDTDHWWDALRDELVPVAASWLLAADLNVLQSATTPQGVRLLPPGDPYTQLRDRDTIVDPEHQREVWKAAGAPGTILVDGRIAGTWRARKQGRRLSLTCSYFGAAPDPGELQVEAERLASVRAAELVEVR